MIHYLVQIETLGHSLLPQKVATSQKEHLSTNPKLLNLHNA